MKTVRAMITHLQELYGKQSRIAHYKVSKRLFNTKMHEGQLVHDHCLTMINDLEELEKLEMTMHKELQVDLILQSLRSSYGWFIVNYHMNKIDSTLSELLNMLVTTERTLKSSRGTILAMERASTFKRKSTWKKKKSAKKQKQESKPKKDTPKKVVDKRKYFHCNVDGN